jgi:hypothetical protein
MLIDIKNIKAEALKEINAEKAEVAKKALIKQLRLLSDAKDVVSNIERSIQDLEASIADGSFSG